MGYASSFDVYPADGSGCVFVEPQGVADSRLSCVSCAYAMSPCHAGWRAEVSGIPA
jgi:hypothetical protein